MALNAMFGTVLVLENPKYQKIRIITVTIPN
jgi:hypothetical protein